MKYKENPEICVYMPVFQEKGPHLTRALDSFKNWEVKKVICIDGAFPLFEHEGKSKSDDGTREIIQSYDNTILLDTGFNFMPVKNNLAFHTAGKLGFDACLIVGADEYLEGNINKLTIPIDIPLAQVALEEHNPTGKYNKWESHNPRLVINPMFVTCKDVHWFYFYMNELIAFDQAPIVEGITIHCDDTLRPKERDDKMTRYQDRNVPIERFKIKKKYIEQAINAEYPPIVSLQGTMYYTCGCIWRPDGIALKQCEKHLTKRPKYM